MLLSEGQTLTVWRFSVLLLNVLDKHFTHPALSFVSYICFGPYLNWSGAGRSPSKETETEIGGRPLKLRRDLGRGRSSWYSAFSTELVASGQL